MRRRRLSPIGLKRGSQPVPANDGSLVPYGAAPHTADLRNLLFPVVLTDAAPAQNAAENAVEFAEWPGGGNQRRNCRNNCSHRW